MILHTIIAADEVMMEWKSPIPEIKYLNGKIVECRKGQKGLEISRIISTDLKDYLNASMAPGSSLRN